MASTIKAHITDVSVGHLSVKGLMSDDGNFYIAIPQIAERFNVPQKNASRDFKALMGEGFTFLKMSVHGTKVTVNAMPLEVFELLVAKLDRSGNQSAQDFRDDLVGLSLRQLFSDAFGVKFEEEDRQQWLKLRQEVKQVRRSLTDAVKNYIQSHSELSENAIKFMYSNASDKVNKAVFGRIARQLVKDFQCNKDDLRDQFTAAELRHIQQVEDLAMRLVDQHDIEPVAAVDEAKRRLEIPVSDRRVVA
jgi:hypothetical protein